MLTSYETTDPQNIRSLAVQILAGGALASGRYQFDAINQLMAYARGDQCISVESRRTRSAI
jgi:hypothetical protein